MSHPIRQVESPLWNYVEAALYLRVSVVSLKKMQRERKIPFVKVGRRTYFMRQDIETFLIEKCRKEPKPLTSKFEEAKGAPSLPKSALFDKPLRYFFLISILAN